MFLHEYGADGMLMLSCFFGIYYVYASKPKESTLYVTRFWTGPDVSQIAVHFGGRYVCTWTQQGDGSLTRCFPLIS